LNCLGFTDVTIIPPGTGVTEDYRTNRVRVYVDAQGKVDLTPSIG